MNGELYDLGLVLVIHHPGGRYELVWMDCGRIDREDWWSYAGHRYRWSGAQS